MQKSRCSPHSQQYMSFLPPFCFFPEIRSARFSTCSNIHSYIPAIEIVAEGTQSLPLLQGGYGPRGGRAEGVVRPTQPVVHRPSTGVANRCQTYQHHVCLVVAFMNTPVVGGGQENGHSKGHFVAQKAPSVHHDSCSLPTLTKTVAILVNAVCCWLHFDARSMLCPSISFSLLVGGQENRSMVTKKAQTKAQKTTIINPAPDYFYHMRRNTFRKN